MAALFDQVVFSAFSNDIKWDGVIKRWEQPVTVELIGAPTDADYDALNDFLIKLTEKAPGLNISFLEGEGDKAAKIEIHYVPLKEIKNVIQQAGEGDLAYYYINWDNNARFIQSKIAIATDATSQEERNHIMKEDIMHSLGLVGFLPEYPESILYDKQTDTQEPAETDYKLLSMLYGNNVYAGQPKEEALAKLRTAN